MGFEHKSNAYRVIFWVVRAKRKGNAGRGLPATQNQLRVALEAHQAGDLNAAAQGYEAVLQRSPRNADALNLYGVLHLHAGDLDKALELLDAAVKFERKNPGFHNNRGEVLRALDRPQEALKAYQAAIRLDRSFADACINAAFAALTLGAIEDANKFAQKAIALAPQAVEAVMATVEVFRALGDTAAAERKCAQALRLAPSNVDIMATLGLLQVQAGDHANARVILERALNHAPQAVEPRLALAELARVTDERDREQDWLRQVLKLEPSEPCAIRALAQSLSDTEAFAEAASLFERAVNQEPGDVSLILGLAWAWSQSGRDGDAITLLQGALDERNDAATHALLGRLLVESQQVHAALPSLEAAAQMEPAHAEYRVRLADALSMLGRFDDAVVELKHSVQLDPLSGIAFEALAYTGGKSAFGAGLDATLRVLTQNMTVPVEQRASALFALARVDDGKFEHYRQANELMCSVTQYDSAAHRAYVDAIIAASAGMQYPSLLAPTLQVNQDTPWRPIFVVGMPRSGTTLVEQILSTHAGVYGAGELEFFGQLRFSEAPGRPEAGVALSNSTLDALRDRYLAQIRPRLGGLRCFTDKMPSNFLYLGLISTLFPHARFINCTREPLENCLSVYFQNFSAARYHAYSFNQRHLADYYNDYYRLMQHWKKLLPDRVLDVSYERMVDDVEGVSRQLLTFSGLDWDPRVLEFYTSSRAVSTASMVQVRQPIYRTALKRSERYASELQVLATHLQKGVSNA